LPKRAPGVFAGGGRDERTGDIIVKAVNPAATAVAATIRITGAEELQPLARVTTLSGSGPADENTLDEPGRVVPVGSVFNGVAPEFRYTLKPYSLTVLRLATRNGTILKK
jgi:alpha-N-arabinofuranosidase